MILSIMFKDHFIPIKELKVIRVTTIKTEKESYLYYETNYHVEGMGNTIPLSIIREWEVNK